MKIKLLLFLIIILNISCTHKIEENRLKNKKQLQEEVLESRNPNELLSDLLIKNDADYNQLACILNCSPSTLKRIVNKETFATQSAEIEIKTFYTFIFLKNNDFNDIKAVCVSYSWYNHVYLFMSNWNFWLIFIGSTCLIILFIHIIKKRSDKARRGDTDIGDIFGMFLVIWILAFILFMITFICNYFGGDPDYASIQDNFINTLDTVWETKY